MAGRGRWGENSAVPSVEQAGTRGKGLCSQEPEEGWGSRGLVSSVGLEPMLAESRSVPSCLPPCCVESASLGYANLGVIQPGRRI